MNKHRKKNQAYPIARFLKKLLSLFLVLVSMHTVSTAGIIVADSVQIGNQWRTFKVFLPAGYPNQAAYPAIVNLHARCSNMDEHILYSDMNNVADTAKFIVAYPLGLLDPNDPFGCLDWNDNGRHVWDDVAFISALISRIASNHQVDTNKVYACGFSRGGYMSFTLACELPQKIKGIATVGGGFSIQPLINSQAYSCVGTGSMPVLIIHGTSDQDVNYQGYPNLHAPIDSVLAFWSNANNCVQGSNTLVLPDLDPNDGCTLTQITYNDCRLMHLRVDGGGHSWPGSQGGLLIEIPPKNRDIHASAEIWKFFKQQSLLTLTQKSAENRIPSAYPNPFTNNIQLSANKSNAHCVLRNIIGDVVWQGRNIQTRDFGYLPAGMYVLQIDQDKEISTLKIFKG
ncbi:MAG: PHB depolymerase family esterase [Bacteroidota bacterium]|jgi:polyhydroxybutyrate depolymerase